jgi:hypothetical protein
MQTSITQRLDRFLEGHATDTRKVMPLTPLENVYPGRGAVISDSDSTGTKGRMPLFNKLDLTMSASFISTDVFTGTLKVYELDGTLLTTAAISQTYSGNSHALMIEGIRAKLDSIANSTAVTTDVSNNRSIRLTLAADQYMTIETAFSATGGAAPTVTATKGTNDTLVGIWAFANVGNIDGDVTYFANKVKAPVLVQGDIPVHVQDTDIAFGETPYCIIEADGDHARGTWTNDSAANPSVALGSSKFASDDQSNELALVTLNLP